MRQETCGRSNRHQVHSRICASNKSGELNEITLLKCLYTVLYSMHIQETLTTGFRPVSLSIFLHLTLSTAVLTLISIPGRKFRPRVSVLNFHIFTSYQTLKVIKMLWYILYVVASYISFSLRKALKHFKKMLGHSSF